MQDRDGDDQDRPDETTIIVSNVLPVKLAKDEATGEWSVSWDLDKMRMGGKSTVYNKGTRDSSYSLRAMVLTHHRWQGWCGPWMGGSSFCCATIAK